MMNMVRIRREQLATTDLILDAVYEGRRTGNAGDDPLGPLLGVSNQGGFRLLGTKELPRLLVITTSMAEPDWPDSLDLETGLFTYYGDNRKPGQQLHETPRWGNSILRDLFSRMHAAHSERHLVPPILVFSKAGTDRDVRFLGLAVPGASGLPPTQDLVAIWRHVAGQRFQNYKATFTILNVGTIKREWINDIQQGNPHTKNAPDEWLAWLRMGPPIPLRSTPTVTHRTRAQQLPDAEDDQRILTAVYQGFRDRSYQFEACAAALAELLLPGIVSVDLTRLSRDGGRDAIGRYRIGSEATGINVEFALEAKCYDSNNPVGVKETSRLISRLRHRQFGILVTTSFVNTQAYKEIQEDGHPVLIVCGRDIVDLLKREGMRDSRAVTNWLNIRFSELAKRLQV
jgi:hypothetical protein